WRGTARRFAGVRGRALPKLIKDEYRSARARAVESAPEAQSQLQHVRDLLGTAEQIGAWDETLSDLRLLVDGFLELAHAAEPQNLPEAAAAAGPAPPTSQPAAVVSPAGGVSPAARLQPP